MRERLESWNAFLAAEFSAKKGRAILELLDPSASGWTESLLALSDLTEPEKRRIRSADPARLDGTDVELLVAEHYSEALGECDGLSPAMLVRGDATLVHRPCIAIVGTRSATSYGRVCARKFASEFAQAGAVVVSGGAVGIDGAAHEGALSVPGGKTAAVLACGVDNVYPSAHAGLFNRIRESGLLMSQYALGSKPADYKFIQRNVVVAAMSIAVVVIEAPLKSGAIRTAGFAAEFGREVFVVPGQIDAFGFQGSHALIRDGATLVDHPAQVLEALGIQSGAGGTMATAEGIAAEILKVLEAQAKSVEQIAELTGLAASDILSELTMLELDGLVHREAGGFAKAL
jgi:DNA processing protein